MQRIVHQLRLLMADWLMQMAFRVLPSESREKGRLAHLLKAYLEHALNK